MDNMKKAPTSLGERLWQDTQGASLIEFGAIAAVLFLLIMGITEFGLLLFTQVVLEGIVNKAGRLTTIGDTGGYSDRVSYIKAKIQQDAAQLFYGENVVVSLESVHAGTSPSYVEPELCLTSPPTLGPTCPNGTPFDDANGNGVYDGGTLNNDAGGSGDLVQVNVALPWAFLTPMVGEFFPNGAYVIRTSAVVKNEPF